MSVTKDLTVVGWVQPWNPEHREAVTVTAFLETVETAREMGNLSAAEAIKIIKLKVLGSARIFLDTHPEVKEDISYDRIRHILIQRYKDKHLDTYHYDQFASARQNKEEDPEKFLDRLRKLSDKTLRRVDNAVEQKALNTEADRRLLAQFKTGSLGRVGEELRLRNPATLADALQMAITVYQTEEQARLRDRQSSKIFEVRGVQSQFIGNQREIGTNKKVIPRFGFGFKQRGSGNSTRGFVNKDTGTANASESGNSDRGGQNDRRQSTGGTDRRGIQCFNCGKFGHMARDCRKGQGREGRPWRDLNGKGKRSTPASFPK